MPLGRKLTIGSEEARRQRAELRTSYGNKLSNMNLGRLRSRSNAGNTNSVLQPATTSLRRIASSFAHVSDVGCGSCAALPHEDTEEDTREERAEVLIRSEPFKLVHGAGLKTAFQLNDTASSSCYDTSATSAAAVVRNFNDDSAEAQAEPRNHHLCANGMQSRASERWGQIACTVSALFRVRRIATANPLSELRRLREQRDLLEAFTRPFLYEDGANPK